MSPALARKPLAALSAGTFLALVLSVAHAARPSLLRIREEPLMQTVIETATLPVTPQNYPGLFTTWNRVTNWDSGPNETLAPDPADPWALYKFRDGEPRLIPAPHGPKHVVCMLPKVGSSRWKRLLFVKHNRPQDRDKQIDEHKDRMAWLGTMTREEVVARISKPEHLRFLWLRNPYSRLLSGFLDKGVLPSARYNTHMGNYGAPFEPTPSEFLRFVRALMSMRADGANIDVHFKLQAKLCGIPYGMQYDFHLKVEDIHVWYPDLIALFGLEDTVSSGWNFLPDTPDCFYPLPDKTCDLTDLIIAHHSEFLDVTHRGYHAHKRHGSASNFEHEAKQAFFETATSKHSHSADKHIQEFYNTKEVVELATEYLREDLEQFGYPEMVWNERGQLNT